MATKTPIKADTEELSITDFLKQAAASVNQSLKRNSNVIIGEDAIGGDSDVPHWIKTLIPELDYAVGGFIHPGVPCSRIVEIHGPESVGKSTLALWITKQAIDQLNALAVYQDAEHVLTQEIIKGTKIDMNRVMLDDPSIIEDVFDFQERIIEQLSERNLPIITVLDSIAACSTKNEVNGDMGSYTVGEHARLMSKGLRKIKAIISEKQVVSIWINQTREKIGITFGDNVATFAGKAMNFYASSRIRLNRIKTLKKDNGSPFGITVEATIVKNKVAPPLRKAHYDILFVQEGNYSYPRINVEGAVIDWLKDKGLIGGAPGFYEIEGSKLRRDVAADMFRSDPELFQKYIDLAYSVKQ